jgi:hypothetical protein
MLAQVIKTIITLVIAGVLWIMVWQQKKHEKSRE